MIRRPRYAPADAERIALADCVKTETVLSKFAPRVMALKPVLHCPACALPQRDTSFERDVIVNCGCGLSMIVEPECVYIWRRRSNVLGRTAASMITAFALVGLASFGFYRGMQALDRQHAEAQAPRIVSKDIARLEARQP